MQRLPLITAPTLVMVGGDNAQTHTQGEYTQQRIPTPASWCSKGAGHLMHQQEPAAVSAAVAAFLDAATDTEHTDPTPPGPDDEGGAR